MTEDEARAWIERAVPRETRAKVEAFVALLRAEALRQNLISASSAEHLWARHVVDSAQLLDLDDGSPPGTWIDIGTGAGFPGMVVAILSPRPVIMVETRAKRVDFLQHAASELGLQTTIVKDKIHRIDGSAAVISARAVAHVAALFGWAHHLARPETLWLLPKGRSVQSELADARQAWQGEFHVKQSVTDPEAGIIIARNIRRRSK